MGNNWNSNVNAPIFYRATINKYLFPYLYTDGSKYWFIGNDPSVDTVNARVQVLDFDDPSWTSGNWEVWDGSSFVSDEGMLLTENCIPSKLCVSGTFFTVSGTYEYHDWDHSIGAPSYYNQQVGQYLYLKFTENYGYDWNIANSVGSSSWYAWIKTQNFDDIIESVNGDWAVWNGHSFVEAPSMVVTECD